MKNQVLIRTPVCFKFKSLIDYSGRKLELPWSYLQLLKLVLAIAMGLSVFILFRSRWIRIRWIPISKQSQTSFTSFWIFTQCKITTIIKKTFGFGAFICRLLMFASYCRYVFRIWPFTFRRHSSCCFVFWIFIFKVWYAFFPIFWTFTVVTSQWSSDVVIDWVV